MRILIGSLLAAAAVGFGPAALAADPPSAQPSAAPQMGHGMMGADQMGPEMMGHGAMNMSAMHCMGLSEARLAAIKSDLNITGAQLTLWNAFAEAAKSSGPGMMHGAGAGQSAQPGSGMMMTGPLPARLERHEAMMTAHLDALRKVKAAVSPLYAALTTDQRAKADRLLCGQLDDPGIAKGDDAHTHHPQ
ncbi:Spy/CpxP family protein refolding chaperone [Phenylobacterium aquaticum]|uniref:Spy/CpxP family protein refolding chaperone n=1 Tax=Phenylobacterium aquaticum TaxID=1763816 RepID=UPI001F5C693A|nr:Spy/CpxP family protein refolding chaperone [Phenylobacterium aquaticum]MCI3132817.1 Spy/CpxP family protein refolding chaperone [Phenylobacterium aquaticum]